MDAAEIIEQVGNYFAGAPVDVVAAYVYGSTARGDRTPASDVDIAVLFDAVPASRLGAAPQRIEDDLERCLGLEVQVVVANTAPADLIHRVLRDGQVVLDRDRNARLRFEVDRRNEYFDLLPILHRYRSVAPAG